MVTAVAMIRDRYGVDAAEDGDEYGDAAEGGDEGADTAGVSHGGYESGDSDGASVNKCRGRGIDVEV